MPGGRRKRGWVRKHRTCAAAIALLSLAVVGSWVSTATLQSSYLKQWENELKTRRAQEKIRELEWERQMEQRRRDELLREHEWDLSQEERERLYLHWDQPTAGRCSAHGVRDYRALLLNAAPYHYNWLEPCKDMPITIQGKPYNTVRCEKEGDVGTAKEHNSACWLTRDLQKIWGHWSVEGDSVCSPFFEDWRDNLASARLDHVPSGENGLELCKTTPFKFWDRFFAHPDTCTLQRLSDLQNGDIWGYWEVDDGRC
ncbi:hypothetical protein HWV62_24061 [Athelia sp. TMB]|nr:hypothetical protein HWV62_24061 [Athelia sp. TMB]